MNTTMIAFLLASSMSSSAPQPIRTKPKLEVKKPGVVTLELSTERKTSKVVLTSGFDKNTASELASNVSFMGIGGRVTTQKLGGQEQVSDRTTQILLKFHLEASTPATVVARLEAQLGRCVALASGAPAKKFEASVQLEAEAFEQVRAAIASAPSGLMRLDVYANAIQSVNCES